MYHYARTRQIKEKKNNGQVLGYASFYPKKKAEVKKKKAKTVLRPLHLYKLRSSLNPLPAAELEVDALTEVLDGTFLKGDACTEEHFKKNASDYAVLHLAMHGILNKHNPILSSLAFTENYDTLQDNFLQAYEISQLDLNADLVVLSACETGYGKFEKGEGVMSLARSFMYAGVPALVVSLWEVNDAVTAWMMRSFYENLAQGMSKDEALRAAKLTYLNDTEGKVAHPAFWSPFIQLGDTQSIDLVSRNWFSWKFVSIVLLSLVIVFVLWKFKKREG